MQSVRAAKCLIYVCCEQAVYQLIIPFCVAVDQDWLRLSSKSNKISVLQVLQVVSVLLHQRCCKHIPMGIEYFYLVTAKKDKWTLMIKNTTFICCLGPHLSSKSLADASSFCRVDSGMSCKKWAFLWAGFQVGGKNKWKINVVTFGLWLMTTMFNGQLWRFLLISITNAQLTTEARAHDLRW